MLKSKKLLLLKAFISLVIWIGGWILTGCISEIYSIPIWLGVIMIALSVGAANLFLMKTTEHDDDIDIIRDRKLKEILG